MRVVELKCIPASELFEGCETLKDALSNSNNITWGDSDHCLVLFTRICNELDITADDDDKDYMVIFSDNIEKARIALGIKSGDDFLVDLEK